MNGVLENNVFIDNFGNSAGGALGLSVAYENVVGNVFVGNQSNGNGGAIAGNLITGDFIGNVFRGNRSEGTGGGMYITRQFVGSLRSNTFDGNTAQGGGAVWIVDPTVWVGGVYDSIFTNNIATARFAGAIDTVAITDGIHNTRFVGNRSVLGGGAIAAGAVGAIKQSVFIDNTTTGGATLTQDAGVGGALSLDDDVTLIDSIFLANTASSLNPNGLASGWGGALFHHDAANNTGSTINVSASAGGQAIFYGNTQNPANTGITPNAIHLGNYNAANNNLETTLNIQADGRVLMLDALSAQQDGLTRQSGTPYGNLTTFVNKTGTGDWYLGGESQMRGASTWNINDGVLRLVTTDYGSGAVAAGIDLMHAGTSRFTLGNAATLAGTGSVKAKDITLSGTIRPNTWVNTGTLAPDLLAQANAIIDAVTTAVMADASIPASNKLFVINTQARQQIANLVNVAQDTATFGTLTFEDTTGGTGVTMQDATIDIGLNYVNGNSSPSDKIVVQGATGVLNVTGNNNTINITGLTYTGTTPPDDAGINAGNLNTFTSIIETTGGIVGSPFNLTIAGQPVSQVDFADAFGGVVGNDYKLGVGLSWYSTRKDGALIDQAHGNFTLASGAQFTLNGNLGTRTNTDGINWDGNSLTKKGDGTLILNGVNTYTGLTLITQGELVLGDASHATAQIAGNVTASGVLSGFGTARARVNMLAGSTLAPGSSTAIGTLTAGAVQMNPGSTLAIKLHENGASDSVNVQVFGTSAGTANLNGATLDILNGGSNTAIDWNPETVYTIVTTQNGVAGTFGSVNNTLFSFLDPFVVYNPTTVQLRMIRNDNPFIVICETTNQCEVGSGIDELPLGDPIRGIIPGLPDDQARDAYDNLSGEIYGSMRAALLDDRHLRDALNRRMRQTEGKRLWVDTWGYGGTKSGDANAARTNDAGFGLALGADHQITPDLLVGAFFAYEDKRIRNGSTRNSRSDVDGYSAGLYASGNTGAFELRGGIAYSRLRIDTRRDIAVGSLQGRVTSDTHGRKVQAFTEIARPIAVNDKVTVSPYLNLAQIWLRTNAATESGNAAALDIARQTDSVRVSTLGFRTVIQLPAQTPMQVTADLGWARAFGDTEGKTSNRFAGRGSRFDIRGVGVSKNTALIGVGLQVQLSPNASITAGYQGQFGSNAKSHTGQVQVRVKF